ncbi:MAG TPA: sigma 54-interacting transcriptional regulator [Myxococcaceae bacterium]|nr:sigma 54-interacting transcriptional regulator [Myxococcaceae bacterium]
MADEPTQGTQPDRVAGLPLRTLFLEVIEGPDAGATLRSTSEPVTVGTAEGNDLRLTDASVSRYHLELSRRGDRVLAVDPGSTNGTEVNGVLVERAQLAAGAVLGLGRTRLRVSDGATVSLELHGEDALGGLRGRTPVMRRLMAQVAKAARSDASALLIGESGTGKELIARAIHDQSARAGKPFVTVDCGTLSPGLVASELFGHERGAFTGADRRHAGAFERAHGGTLFLDEVGELPPALQPALLGALDRRRFRRVGGTEEIEVELRVISATNRDLRAEVNSGAFRLDLYYRLAVVRLDVPPLRDRSDDVPVLVEHFLREAGHDGPIDRLISPRVMEGLQKHHWPGNVRELRNLVEAVLAMGEAPKLEAPPAKEAPAPVPVPESLLELKYKDARKQVLDAFERRYLEALLSRAKGNVSQAARVSAMDRSHLIDLLSKHKLR